MAVTFNNAPLVELIAELRWGDVPPPPTGPTLTTPVAAADADQLFMTFGGEIYQHGFRRAERLVPPGFPMFPFQPVFRYRKDAGGDASVVFQVGSGVFSANALPPYRSWKTVEPTIRTGVESLIRARASQKLVQSFAASSLRYINGFGPELRRGRDLQSFVKDIFKFDIEFPAAIVKQVQNPAAILPQLQFTAPLRSGSTLICNIAEGVIQNETKLILDLTVSDTRSLPPNADRIMNVFRESRDVLHQIFVELTMPIQDLLEPIGDDHAA